MIFLVFINTNLFLSHFPLGGKFLNISIEPEKDTKFAFENGERKEIELDTYHLNVKGVGFDPFIDKEYEVGLSCYHPEMLNVRVLTIDGTDHGRNYLVFKDKDELIAYVNRGIDAINGKDTEFLKTDNVSDELIKETIKWWKMKNKVKHPITSNDVLAYKQILNKLQKLN